MLAINSYLWTYDLYGPICNAFDAGKSIRRSSGRGLGPWNQDFFGPFQMASSRKASAISRYNKIFPKGLWNYSSKIMGKIYISQLEQQRWSLEFVISVPKVNIRDLGSRLGLFFWDHVIQISLRLMNFRKYVLNSEK
jgi:hypothetical protein